MNFSKRLFTNASEDSNPPFMNAAFMNEFQDALIEARDKFTVFDVDAAFSGAPPTIAPDPAKAGRLGIATDKMRVYRDTGTAWQLRASAEWGDIVGRPGLATTTDAGLLELATLSELQSGAAGILTPTAATIKAELDRRKPAILLSYVSTTDIANGAAAAQNAWTNLGPQHSFVVGSAESAVEIIGGGIVLMGTASAGVISSNSSRFLLDGVTAIPIGGANSNGSNDFANALAGNASAYRTGLAAGSHTLQLQLRPNAAGIVMYCRSASNPGEAITVTVVEHG